MERTLNVNLQGDLLVTTQKSRNEPGRSPGGMSPADEILARSQPANSRDSWSGREWDPEAGSAAWKPPARRHPLSGGRLLPPRLGAIACPNRGRTRR